MFTFKNLDEMKSNQISNNKKSIFINAIGQIIIPEDASVDIAISSYSPEYAQSKKCMTLSIKLNIESNSKGQHKLLEFNTVEMMGSI